MKPDHSEEYIRSQINLYNSTANMTDRERAMALGLPEGCRIREGAKILCPENFSCGRNVWIGEGAILDAQGGLSIGDFTQVGSGVMVWSHTSVLQALAGETCTSGALIRYKPTSIGSRCWIGGPSVIYPGVKIGDGVAVMPLSVVDKDIPSGKLVTDNQNLKQCRNRMDELEARLRELEGKVGQCPVA
jgi:acetyltransferase-like isoleucine patch superfamily enzyme